MCHDTIIEFGERNLKKEDIYRKRVIEIGSKDVNGSLRPYIEKLGCNQYIGVDIEPGKGVDVICNAEDIIERFGKESFDVVISTELLEHVKNWKKVINNIKDICKDNGIIILTTRSKGFGYHDFGLDGGDHWRFEIEYMIHIFSDCIIEKLEKDIDNLPGVFIKTIKRNNKIRVNLSNFEAYSMLKERVVVGITTYKVDKSEKLRNLTEKCIKSVVDDITQIGTGMNAEIIIVDTMSDPIILNNISKDKKVKIFHNYERNVSKSWNDICKYAFYNIGCDHCLIMNNDIVLKKESLYKLMNFVLDDKNKNIIQNRIIYGSEDFPEFFGDINIKKGWTFSCFLINKNLYETIGEFDEKLAFYANDWDYLERCKSVGKEPLYYKDFVVVHEKNSTKSIFESVEKEESDKIHNSDVEYYRKKWKDKGVNLP